MSAFRITFGGRLAGAQRWSIGISANPTGSPTTPTAADMSALAVQLFTDFNNSAWSASASGTLALAAVAGDRTTFDQVRAYYYGGGSSTATVVGLSTQAAVAGTGASNQAVQTCIVASLLTGLAGRSNRGRVYIPNGTRQAGTDGTFAAASATGIATSMANFLSLMRTRSVAGMLTIPVVDSSTGADNPITTVRVDNVPDTQRRRRDKIAATTNASVNLIVG